MLIIKKPQIIDNTLECQIVEDGVVKKIWFSVEREYAQFLCDENCDAFLIGLLSYAMRNNHDIKLDAPITDTLLYNITNVLIPSLSNYDKNLYNIRIIETSVIPAVKNIGAVGTGLSLGVDSFHSILMNLDDKFPLLKISHLCINNVGSFNECYGDKVYQVKDEIYRRAKKVAKILNLPIIITNSNFAQEFVQNHLLTHSFSSMFAVFCLQKLWKVYFYGSSGYDFSQFTLKHNSEISSDHYELLLFYCISTQNLSVYSDGGAQNRLEKLKDIVDNEIVQKNLHVCLTDSKNCGKCSKCLRTLFALDGLNKLELYNEVFDIDIYKKNRRKYLKNLYKYHLVGDVMNEPTYQLLKDRISQYAKIVIYIRYCFSKFLKIMKLKRFTK